MTNRELALKLAEQAKRGQAFTEAGGARHMVQCPNCGNDFSAARQLDGDPGLADIFTGMLNRYRGMSFKQLAAINIIRANRWHKGGITEWNAAEWSNAMAGEAGEACNATKKLRRIECAMQQADGDTPAPKSMEEAEAKVLKEVGDTVIYADLLCQRVGGTLEDAVRLAFNSVSEREGFPERI